MNADFGLTNDTHFTLAFKEVSRQEWAQAGVEETEEQLIAFGEIVMARDEEPYMDALAKMVTSNGPSSTVLEIGFGMAICSSFIQKWGCGKHVIVEANAAIMKKCL